MISPLNGNILVKPIRNQTEKIFKESDSRKDLQYAVVVALPPEPIVLSEVQNLEVDHVISYNPRNLLMIIVDGEARGMVHNESLYAKV